MNEHIIAKGLEIWILQTLLDISIILGIFALGFVIIQNYYNSLQKYLTLRVSIEIWALLTVLITDLVLAITVIIGFLILNPDIMADIKVAVPFIPLATVLFAMALLIRLFYNGHKPKDKNFRLSTWLIFIANLINIIGFSFIMEAPGKEYLDDHPSEFWEFIKMYFRSNSAPHGIGLAQISFYVFYPLLLIIFVIGFSRFMKNINKDTVKN